MPLTKPMTATVTLSRKELEELINEALVARGMSPTGKVNFTIQNVGGDFRDNGYPDCTGASIAVEVQVVAPKVSCG